MTKDKMQHRGITTLIKVLDEGILLFAFMYSLKNDAEAIYQLFAV